VTTEEIYFSGKRVIEDFLTLKGVERKIGVGRKDVYTFILKELLDNALDYSENQEEPMIGVDLEILPGGENVKVVVSNSNDSNNPAFTEQRLKSVFNFKDMVSSKRNLFRITRGALGDAFKHIIGMPYALADDLHIEITQAPLTIYTKAKIYTVSLVVDRRTGLVNADVVESQTIHNQGKDEYIAANYFTKIELLLPIIDGFSLGRLQIYLCDYTIFNTHVCFRFKITDSKGQVYNDHYQQTQSTTTTKNNAVVTSIHWYSKEEFHQLINALDNGDRQVYDVIKLFRESSNMSHAIKFDNMLIANLTSNLVDELYQKLMDAIKTAPTNLILQFNTNKTVRAAALKKRLEQRYDKISNVKFKSVSAITGIGRDKFPYYFEITICTVDALTSNLILIDTINSSMMPSGSHTYLKGDENTFYWITAKMQRYTTNHIIRLLENYQYSYEIQKGKKKKSVVMINLVTPNKIHFKNYGKSDIDVQPFADAISECTVKCCKGGATQQDRKSQIDCMREILTDRRVEIQRSREDILRRKSWVRSTAFYNCRKLMLENGYTAEEINRDTVTGYIEQICEE
jgi:hypothetical protein